MTVSKQLIQNIEELRKSLNEISVYDFDVYTSMELYYKIANKLNEVIKELMRFEGLVSDEVVEQNEKLIYLIGEGLNIEVVKKINQMIEDGTMDSIINHNVFNSLNNKIDECKEELTSQIKEIENNRIKEVLLTDFESFQECVDYCYTNNKIMRIPKGTHTITETVNVKGVTIIGDGCNNTTVVLTDCDGFLLDEYNSQKNVTISDFSIYSKSQNMYEICGIKFKEQTGSKRSRGYKLKNLYFENLGCAIELSDCFRVGISKININNCYRSILIKGQVVQLTCSDIISNCDISDCATSSRYGTYKIGIEIIGSNHTGSYLRPESIRFNNVAMVHYDTNVKINDVLYCNFLQCDFDLSRKECLIIKAYDGGLTIGESWISTCSSTEEPIINILKSDEYYKKLTIKNSNISVLSNGNAEKIGIALGLNPNDYFKKGVSIINNTIKSYKTPLKYGIYANRPKNLTIKDNHIQGCTTADIYCNFLEGGNIDDNCCDNINVISNSTLPYSIKNNIGNVSTTGTATKYIDFSKSLLDKNVVIINEFITANTTKTVTHNFGKTFDKLNIEIYTLSNGEFLLNNDFKIAYIDTNKISVTNLRNESIACYLKISVR